MNMKIRMTLMLDEAVVRKLKATEPNMSGFVNELVKKALFGKPDSMFGALAGRISGKDKIEDPEDDE